MILSSVSYHTVRRAPHASALDSYRPLLSYEPRTSHCPQVYSIKEWNGVNSTLRKDDNNLSTRPPRASKPHIRPSIIKSLNVDIDTATAGSRFRFGPVMHALYRG